MALTTCCSSYDLPTQQSRTVQVPVQKDYSRPLHVDCSVEYELPNQAKPPQGIRNEPLLMIHPCYFRKIESQRRSPFINNLPATTRQQHTAAAVVAVTTPTSAVVSKRRVARTQQHHQPPSQQLISTQTPQYPLQYTTTAMLERYPQQPQLQIPHHPQQQQQQQQQQQIWEPMPPLVPISAAAAIQQQSCCKRDALCGGVTYNNSGGSVDSGHWTDPDRSPDRPEDKHILTGKYRQYLRAHRLHPYISSAAFPVASAFPQIHQQVCYNV